MGWRIYIYFALIFLHFEGICFAAPVNLRAEVTAGQDVRFWSHSSFVTVLGIISGICLILTVGICVCCSKSHFKLPFSGRRIRRGLGSTSGNGFINNGHEIAIFPPPGAEQYLSSTSGIHFDPLPDITSQLNGSTRPPRLSASVSSNLNEDWFAEPFKNFPRNQLQYVRKLGSGWFGQVLEGRAIGVDTDHTSTAIAEGETSNTTTVVVKALREDSSAQEQALFLQELIPYRDLNHENILKIVAYCIETQPLLVLLQYCPKGDLKSVLKKDNSLTDANLLKMAENVADGLSFMHQHDFIHTDVAARNCVVENDLNVRIGDYGYSVECYKSEYYLAENVALPIRWCAPESLRCTETTIETIELTKGANIWSFGVLVWEIFSRGKLPYEDLDEDGVIQKVVLERSRVLSVSLQGQTFYATKLNDMLEMCFKNVECRPVMPYLKSLLGDLFACFSKSSSNVQFEERWNQLSSNDERPLQHNLVIADNAFDMRFESDFTPRAPLVEKGSPTPSLKNLHGSAEDLDARIAAKFGSVLPSWLGLEPGQPMDSFTEEISDAIQRLDEALSEDRSESTTCVSSPEKTNFRLGGSDSLVQNPPGMQRAVSYGEEENLTLRLEQGDFSELVRLKSQSVQDFMRLTVVDDGSDSDKTSQPGSLLGEFSAPVSRHQEKNFSSESNLEDAVRDAGFMVELERLQAGHKFSIISEASRDGMEGMNPSSDSFQEGFRNDPGSDIAVDFPDDSTMQIDSKDLSLNIFPIPLEEQTSPTHIKNYLQRSPDCIVSSRGGLPSAILPDIVAHNENAALHSPSDSSLDKEETRDSPVRDGSFPEFPSDDHGGKRDDHDENVRSEADEGKGVGILEHHILPVEAKSSYLPENIVLGEKIIIGALEDYSLEPFKPARSSCTSLKLCNDIFHPSNSPYSECGTFGLDNELNDINDTSKSNSSDLTITHLKDSSNNDCESSLITHNNEGELTHFTKNGVITLETNDKENYLKTKKLSDVVFDSTSNLVVENVIDNLNSPEKNPYNYDITNTSTESQSKDVLSLEGIESHYDSSDASLQGETKMNKSDSGLGTVSAKDSTESDSFLEESYYSEREESASKRDPINTVTQDEEGHQHAVSLDVVVDTGEDAQSTNFAPSSEMKSGEFWERQMAAWQEAAEATRALLHKATHKDELATPQRGSEEDLLDLTRSPASSLKSPFSSSDRLDDTDDDEGTYVSYDTADDDDALRFSHDDLSALRSELSLKLGDTGEEQQESVSDEEDGHDFVFINYKSGCALSPIKEEDHSADLDVDRENNRVDLEEGSAFQNSGGVPVPELALSSQDTTFELGGEEAKNSLILEDLENPTSATIVGPTLPATDVDSGEDIILVDTETNRVMLLDSGRPQSLIAFQTQKEETNIDRFSSATFTAANFDDDVAPESLPYEDTSGIQLPSLHTPSREDDPTPMVEISDEDRTPHYQSYFKSGLSSISYPTPSLEGRDAFESADHVSLPYDVNLPIYNCEKTKEEVCVDKVAESNVNKSTFEAEIVEDDSDQENSFVTLSFLGRLYSAVDAKGESENKNDTNDAEEIAFVKDTEESLIPNSSMEYFSTKSETDSSDNEIEEKLPPEYSPPPKLGVETPTPIRTPSSLADFHWRGDPRDQERYTPDWESDSDGNEDLESSSTSGEFIWQPGDGAGSSSGNCPAPVDNTSLEWQMANEKVEEEQPHCSSPGEDSESGEEEFTPSTWNSELTPHRSLLKSPETNSGGKKSVHWKRQRHHRVYEYPPEPQSWHAELPIPRTRRSWGGHSLDYLTLADWELGGDEFLGDDSEDFEEFFPKGSVALNGPQIYSLGPLNYENSHEDFYSDGVNFFMGGPPGSPYSFSSSSFTPAEFFPSDTAVTNYDFIFADDESKSLQGEKEESGQASEPEAASKTPPEETKILREKLRLDLPTLCVAEAQTQHKRNENP